MRKLNNSIIIPKNPQKHCIYKCPYNCYLGENRWSDLSLWGRRQQVWDQRKDLNQSLVLMQLGLSLLGCHKKTRTPNLSETEKNCCFKSKLDCIKFTDYMTKIINGNNSNNLKSTSRLINQFLRANHQYKTVHKVPDWSANPTVHHRQELQAEADEQKTQIYLGVQPGRCCWSPVVVVVMRGAALSFEAYRWTIVYHQLQCLLSCYIKLQDQLFISNW